MNAVELREMDDPELLTHLAEAKQELFNLRFQHVTGQLDNYRRLGQVRRDIARINTVLRERELAPRSRKPQREFVFAGRWGEPLVAAS